MEGLRAWLAEHGRFRAVMESFAYLPPFGGMFKKTSPFYAESYWYCMGGITFLMFLYLTLSGILLAWLGPFWWLTSPVGKALKGSHYWAALAELVPRLGGAAAGAGGEPVRAAGAGGLGVAVRGHALGRHAVRAAVF